MTIPIAIRGVRNIRKSNNIDRNETKIEYYLVDEMYFYSQKLVNFSDEEWQVQKRHVQDSFLIEGSKIDLTCSTR